jgi:SAM-dependent methyltransferase
VRAFSVAPVDPRVYAILAEAGFSEDLFNPRQHRSCELVELYVLHLAIELIRQLGVEDLLAHPRTVEELLDARGFVPAFSVPLRWLLERLGVAALVKCEPERDRRRYRLRSPLPQAELAGLRTEGLEADPSYAPAFALVDEAAAIYPRVARGETTGERALFQKVGLWSAYFSNENGYYALNNQVAARVAAARFPSGGGAILEVGAGLGSATAMLLGVLRERGTLGLLTSYQVTEPVVFFRRRAQRSLEGVHSGLPLAFSALDINQPWAAQGVAPGSQQMVWGVNVFHLARDLDVTLREAFDALAPGGLVVLGEGLRPFPGRPVGAEFPFQILESFVAVRTDPETRPTHGFLTPEQWQNALARAGFAAVEIVPDAIRLREVYPGLLTAAVCGRRPARAGGGVG